MQPDLTNILNPQRQVADMDSIMQEVENAKLAAELERMAAQKQRQRPAIRRTPQERSQVPVSSDSYTIQRGDTLWDISRKTGVSIEELARYNGIQNPNMIRAGAKLYLPQRSEALQRPLQAPTTPPNTPVMQSPRTPPPTPPVAPQNGPQNIMGLGGLMRKMGQQVDPTVLGAMAGLGGAGGMAGMMGRSPMNSAMRPNPARAINNSAMYPNPARMQQTIAGGTQNSGMTLDDLYKMFGRQ